MTMLDAALTYARQGWAVFPIRKAGETYRPKDSTEDVIAGGKEPATANGFLNATIDETQIRKWWSGKNADRNIGLVTSPASGFWVLDADIDKETGEFGSDTIEEWRKEFGSLPPHPIALTPGGGQHHFFAWPDDGLDIQRRIRFAPGLDALGMRGGKGGYLVAVPSVRPEGEYKWQVSPDVADLPQAPKWLLDMVRADRRERPADMSFIEPVKSDRTSKYGRKALMGLVQEVEGAPLGQQEVTLSKCAVRAGSLAYGGNIDVGEAFSSIMAAAMRMPNQGGRIAWTETQIERKIRTAFAKAIKDPTPPPRGRGGNKPQATHTEPPPPSIEDRPPDADDHSSDPEPPPDISSAFAADEAGETATEEKPDRKNKAREPFRYLGYNRDTFYYLPEGKGQVVGLRASEHSALRLLEIAPMTFWLDAVQGQKVTKEQWLQLADGMMRNSERQGIFEPQWVRGRGAWLDGKDKKVIVHTGTEAIIDGNPVALNSIRSRYVYEAGAPWDFGFGEPLSNAEAHRLVQVCERLTWAEPMSGALLAGWNVIAPFSGALYWRSHIWITGPSGSGKSTAQKDIVGRVTGPAAEQFEGKVTEAAIRQVMGSDARPVVLDEAESESLADVGRMQAILDLARVSSSGGKVPKGGSNHKATIFTVRSCFCFSSINTAVRHLADESRISKLVLVPNTAPDADKHFTELMRDINAWLTPEFAAGLFARTVKYLPTLLKNCETFTAAAAIIFKSRRAADQLGPMLAGYYLLHKTDHITVEAASKFIQARDWSDYLPMHGTTDEARLFEYLMSQMVKVPMSGGQIETTIGVALERSREEIDAPGELGFGDRRKGAYTMALSLMGIKYDDGMIGISNSASSLRKVLRDAPQWQNDWQRPLRNLPGAVPSKNTERFAPGLASRATWIPFGLLDGSYRPREAGEDG